MSLEDVKKPTPLQMIALGLAFLLELVAFFGFASVGWLISSSKIVHIIMFVVLLTALITFWSLFMAPRAVKKFKAREYYIAKVIIYALAAFGLEKSQGLAFAIVFSALALLDEATLFKHNLS